VADNYKDTAYRMYESSEILYKNKQWFNSNYLAGYVLECYCKLILSYTLSCGGVLSRTTIRGYSHDIDSMRNDIDLILLSGGNASQYCIDICVKCSKIISNWNPNCRYENATHILNDSVLANDINLEIENLINLILKMEVDGVI
jgi:hypothetical protein